MSFPYGFQNSNRQSWQKTGKQEISEKVDPCSFLFLQPGK